MHWTSRVEISAVPAGGAPHMIRLMFHRRAILSAPAVAGFVIGLSLLLPAPAALAWGPDGHKIVADIAEARLTPKAKAAVAQLLSGDTTAHTGNTAGAESPTLASIANWADSIRKEREETATWHYVDIPYEMKAFDLQRDGKNGNNVVSKLQDFAAALNDRNVPPEQRVEALKFVVHFMGD